MTTGPGNRARSRSRCRSTRSSPGRASRLAVNTVPAISPSNRAEGIARRCTSAGRIPGMSPKATSSVTGLHHVTAIAGDPQRNLDFYTGALGLRLVKRTVNQDAPDTYHLFYADAEGHAGSDITFFPWPDLPPGKRGVGLTNEVAL